MSKKVGLWGPKGETRNSRTQPDSHNGVTSQMTYSEKISSRIEQEGIQSSAGLVRMALTTPQFTEKGIRRIRWGVKDAVWGMVFLILFSIVVTGIALVIQFAQEPESMLTSDGLAVTPVLLLFSALAMYAAWGISLTWASKIKGFGTLAKDFLVRFKWKHDIIFAVVATIILRIVEQVVQFVVVNVFGFDISASDNAGNVAAQQGIWWVINAIIVAAILAPLFEELFFRGLFLQGLHRTFARFGRLCNRGRSNWVSKHAIILSLIISSIVFGFMHFPGTFDAGGIYLVTYTGVLGLLLGMVALKYKRLGPSIMTHILFNLSGVILATILQ